MLEDGKAIRSSIFPRGTSTPVPVEFHAETEHEPWRFIAPKMLKREADDHAASSYSGH